MVRPNSHSPPRRRVRRAGAILLVVLALLALFAVIGLSFVLYAESEANAARVHRDATTRPPDSLPPDPTPAAEDFLKQVFYGDPDNDRSAVFGHSLSALKYGGQGGTAAYNGVGTIAGALSGFPTAAAPGLTIANLPRQDVIHYGRFGSGQVSATNTGPEYVIDPEHVYGAGFPVRAFATAVPNSLYDAANQRIAPAAAPGAIYVPKNAGYTYPDRNNAMLALVTPPEPTQSPTPVTDAQQVVAISGYRASLFGSLNINDPTPNPNWTNAEGRHKILRPRPADHVLPGETAAQSQFPYPPVNADGTVTGDVTNYTFVNGQVRNDSIWMYPGLPVSDYRGKKITALIAPMLLPLDGRVPLNAGGNQMAAGGVHGSHSGFGPHEIALWRALQTGATTEADARTAANQIVQGRQVTGSVPAPQELPTPTTAALLAQMMPTGSRYPAFPQAPPAPFGVKTFNPAAAPFAISGTGPQSVLQANQVQPPANSVVNFGAANLSYALPGGSPPTDPASRYYGSTPDYTQWTTAVSRSVFNQGNASTNTAPSGDTVGHPLLWNPLHRAALQRGVSPSGAGQFPLADLFATAARYSQKADNLRNQSFVGDPARPFAAAFNTTGPNDPSNVRRALTTPISNSQQSAELGPNFFNSAGRTLQLAAGSTIPAFPGATPTRPTFVVPPGAADAGSDTFDGAGSNQQLANRVARLGPVDLNRRLADYPTAPDAGGVSRLAFTGATTPQVQLADSERQQFAYDIFVRLAASTGGAVSYDTTLQQLVVDPGVAATDPRYDALRYLAQYAANIVDAIDADDVSFAFVWKPDSYADPRNAGNFSASETPNRVVFGVEKPRLVLNEVYAELANSEQDAMAPNATKPFEVRFFAELLNPSSSDANSVQPQNVPLANDPAMQSAYRLEVFDDSPGVRTQLGAGTTPTQQTARNVTGEVDTALGGFRRRINMNFLGMQVNLAAGEVVKDTNGTPNPTPASAVEPNDGLPEVTVSGTDYFRAGFAMVGPGSQSGPAQRITESMPALAYSPDVATGRTKVLIQKPHVPPPAMVTGMEPESNAMSYYLPLTKNGEITTDPSRFAVTKVGTVANIKRHAVLLRRLANPYLDGPTATNPYVTVDAVYDVEVYDSLRVVEPEMAGNDPTPRDPLPERKNHYSIGRSQPYAGYTPVTTPGTAPDAYSQASRRSAPFGSPPTPPAANLTLRQKSAGTGTPPTDLSTTFQSHNFDLDASANSGFTVALPVPNGTAPQQGPVPPNTINPAANNNRADRNMQYPFAWMPHFDRPLINQGELLHVAACKPHALTFEFAQPGALGNPATDGRVEAPAADNLHTLANGFLDRSTAGAENSPLYRALELLQVKPWVHDTPLGGRVAGKININTVWDRKVFEALLDQNAGSAFTAADVDRMWTQLCASRTPGYPAVGATSDEVAAPTSDRPFKAFGVPAFAAAGNRAGDSGLDDTLLRRQPGGNLLFRADSQTHPYAKTEPLRKILNNVTTTTDTFLLIYTVSFFEVRNEGPHYPAAGGVPVVLGKEVFQDVPGDLRAQFVAVLDRSSLGLPADTTVNAPKPPRVWESELVADAVDGTNNTSFTPNATPTLPSTPTTTYLQVQVRMTPGETRTPVNFVAAGSSEYTLDTTAPVYGFYSGRDDDRTTPDGPGPLVVLRPGTLGTEGTAVGLGLGNTRIKCDAFADATRVWRYNPLSGVATVFLRVRAADALPGDAFATTARSYRAGTILSSANPGYSPQAASPVPANPLAQALDPKVPSPQVPLFGRLNPQ